MPNKFWDISSDIDILDGQVLRSKTDWTWFESYDIESALNNKADQSTTYTKTETDNLLDNKLEADDIVNFETTTQLNARDTANRNRANHTWTQLASTISDFQSTVSSNTDVVSNTSARHTHSNKALLDTYAQTEASLADAVTKKHTHSNKTILDNTTASFTTADETKLDWIEPWAEVNNISDINATDLTDWWNTTLHTHDSRYYTESETDTLLSSKQNTLTPWTWINIVWTTISSTINWGLVWTKTVDETNIWNLKVPVYKTASWKLEYENQTWWHIIEDTWVAFTQRDTLNFTWNVVVTDTGTKTEVEIWDTWVAISPSYAVTNTINDRILNWNNVSLNELTDVVWTMIWDLRIFSWLGWNAPLFIQDTEPSVTVPSLWIDTTWWNFSFNLVTP